jgi:hypothetical protein
LPAHAEPAIPTLLADAKPPRFPPLTTGLNGYGFW